MTPVLSRAAAIAAALALLVAGWLAGRWSPPAHEPPAPGAATTPPPASAEREVRYWYDPMVPDQHFDKPGKSPFMDMALVPKYADEVAAAGVRIGSGLQQSIGLRTAAVETGRLPATRRVPGTLAWDPRLESVVAARAEGVVARVQVKAPFTRVMRGQPLATLVVPAWSGAIAEAQALRQAQSSSARALRTAAEQRLRVLGVPPDGVNRDGSVTLTAAADGLVTEVLVREGEAVPAGAALFRINGTSTVWLEAAVPQTETATLRPGTPVEAVVTALPGRTFSGDIEALLPPDTANRALRARIVLRNPEGLLTPGLLAEVSLSPKGGEPVPLVPTEALIATGADSRVIVVGDDGAFVPVRVQVGRSAEERTEILSGLAGGERVVVSGQFLIDSEASLAGALTRLGEAPGPAPPPSRVCRVAYWYDPMVPEQHFDKSGKSPFMDMQLVPKFAAGSDPACTIEDVAGRAETQP